VLLAATLTTPTFLLAWVVATTAAVFVFFHANKRGSKHATAWGIGVFLVLGLALPVYIVHDRRRKTPNDNRRY
jgi:ABC-type Mn2+/Zn2+ transport system permease subunit